MMWGRKESRSWEKVFVVRWPTETKTVSFAVQKAHNLNSGNLNK